MWSWLGASLGGVGVELFMMEGHAVGRGCRRKVTGAVGQLGTHLLSARHLPP